MLLDELFIGFILIPLAFAFSLQNSIETTPSVPTPFSLIPTTTSNTNEYPTSALIKPPHKSTHDDETNQSYEKDIQEKIKRLKKLRGEVRELINQLKFDRRMKDEVIAIQITQAPGLKNDSLAKWKGKIRNRVRSILKRLEKLEKVMKVRKSEIREARLKLKKTPYPKTTEIILAPTKLTSSKTSKRRARKPNTKPTVVHLVKTATSIPTSLHSATWPSGITMSKMHIAFNQARNKSLSGDLGSSCNSHNECKPGLCCHKTSTQSDGSTTTYECVRYAKKELDYCEHSCACSLGLHCFRDTRGIGSILPKSAFCKKASPDDALNGIYENAKDRVFEDEKNSR